MYYGKLAGTSNCVVTVNKGCQGVERNFVCRINFKFYQLSISSDNVLNLKKIGIDNMILKQLYRTLFDIPKF